MAGIDMEFPPVEEDCPFCDPAGSGHDDDGDKCHNCGGTGKRPTEFGYAVLRLMKNDKKRKAAE